MHTHKGRYNCEKAQKRYSQLEDQIKRDKRFLKINREAKPSPPLSEELFFNDLKGFIKEARTEKERLYNEMDMHNCLD